MGQRMGAMARSKRADGVTRRAGRGLAVLCMIVLALCVTHLMLMASERHAAVMWPLHEQSMAPVEAAADATIARADGVEAHERPAPPAPVPLMGDCPAQQGIIPLLLALSLLLGAWVWGTTLVSRRDARHRPSSPRHGIPPLLPPPQRRALLQVFRI